jgi:ribonuclease D
LLNLAKKINFWLKKKKLIYLIESSEDLKFVKNSLQSEKLLGIDTEFAWRNTYYPKLSLLQIATSKCILLIDCIKCDDLFFLKEILEDKDKLIIFHSTRSDTTVLNTNLNIRIRNNFDIQIAEKNILGGEIKNYASIVSNYFPIKLNKSETNSNWLKRPFSNKQLSYAAEDVSFLLDIYLKQIKKLKKIGILEKTFEESRKEAGLGNQKLHIARLKKLKKVTKLEKDIFLWRENFARKKNIPPSYVFYNNSLKKISKEVRSKKLDKNNLSHMFKSTFYIDDFLRDLNL